jgi:MYXO-CTERM domain-containing protein
MNAIAVPPLSTVLLELDVGRALAPEARAAATGCMDELSQNPRPAMPDLGPPGDGGDTMPGGCGCRLAANSDEGPRTAWALLAVVGGLFFVARRRGNMTQ